MKNKIVICASLVVLVVALIVVAVVCAKRSEVKKDPLDDFETVATLVETGYKLDIKSEKKGVEKTTDDQMYIVTVENKEYIGEKAEKSNETTEENADEEDKRDYWDSLYTVVYKNIFEHSASNDFSNVNTWDTIVISNKKYKYSITGDKAELVYEMDNNSYMLIEINYISKVKYNFDGNILERDDTSLTEDILKSDYMAKVIRFKIKKFDPETDKLPEEKQEVKDSEEKKPENSAETNETK